MSDAAPARPIDSFLGAVARRDYLARLARTALLALAIAAGAELAALLAVRLSGLVADPFGWSTLAIPPLAALAAAVLAVRPTRRAAAARIADRALEAEDLFATAADPGAPGEFKPVVLKQAAARAAGAKPAAVVPWRARGPRPVVAGGVLAALALALALVPQLDPFGRQSERKRTVQRQAELERERAETKKLIEELKQQRPEAKLSAEVAKELEKLQAQLDAMKAQDKDGNQSRLEQMKTEAARLLEQERAERFSHSVDPEDRLQQLGGDAASAEALRKQLEKGETAEATKQLDELKTMAEQLAKTTDPAERAKLADKMRRQLETLQQSAKSQPAGFTQATRQALDQLAQSGAKDLSDQSLQALRDSLDLAKLQMEQGAQGERDLQSMQEALQAMHLAQQLNKEGKLDGQLTKGQGGLEDYKKLYAEALAKGQGQGQGGKRGDGSGMGEGPGDGSTRPEDNSKSSAFNPEQDTSPLSAGKTLMQWKEHGPSEAGKVEDQYQAVRAVQQGVSEALVREQVPPGYHDGVKKYFDGLDQGK